MKTHYVVVDVQFLIPIATFDNRSEAAAFAGERLASVADDACARPLGVVIYKTETP
jgi:hypothetical protein